MATLLDALSIGTRTRKLMISICSILGLDSNGLYLDLSFEIFLPTLVKMVNIQGIKDSTDIFLLVANFPIMRLCRPYFTFSPFLVLGSLKLGPLLTIL